MTPVHADCDVATLSRTAGLYLELQWLPQTNSDGSSHATKCARSGWSAVQLINSVCRLLQSRITKTQGNIQTNHSMCSVPRIADMHIPVNTCVQHMTSIIYRALHNSVERERERTANITTLIVSALPEWHLTSGTFARAVLNSLNRSNLSRSAQRQPLPHDSELQDRKQSSSVTFISFPW